MPRRESWPTDHDQCCVVGLYVGGLFPLLCSLPEPASNPGVSLSMKICAPGKAGRRKRLSSFSFLWLACVANVSARVNARKLETEQKKKKILLSLSPSASFRAITRAETLTRRTILWSFALRYQSLTFRARPCAKNEAVLEEGGSPKIVPLSQHQPRVAHKLKTFSVSIRSFTCFFSPPFCFPFSFPTERDKVCMHSIGLVLSP